MDKLEAPNGIESVQKTKIPMSPVHTQTIENLLQIFGVCNLYPFVLMQEPLVRDRLFQNKFRYNNLRIKSLDMVSEEKKWKFSLLVPILFLIL